MESYLKTNKEHVAEELVDVLYWVLTMSHDLGIDIIETANKKMDKNEVRYPVEKSKGNHTKYDKL